MALPALLLPGISAGLSLLNTGLSASQSARNRKFQQDTNTQQLEWNRKMYLQQRFDSLMDWNRQNKYNSPEQQMQRLKEAGLNPNLVYGTGAVANNSSGVQHTSASSPHLSAPQSTFDSSSIPNVLSSFQDARIKQITTDNLQKQGDLLLAQTADKNMDVANKGIQGETSQFNLDRARELKDSVITEQKLRNEKMRYEIGNISEQQEFSRQRISQKDLELELRKREVDLKSARTTADLAKIHEDILRSMVYRQTNPVIRANMEANLNNAVKEGKLKDIEIQLKSMGLNPGSPEYINRWTSMVRNILQGIGDVVEMGK